MNICSRCKKEYEEYIEKCPECGTDKSFKKEKGEDWIVLTNVKNDIEYELIAGILQMGNIPSIKKLKGMDAYFIVITGTPIAEGIDILVPPDRYEEAVQLLNAEIDEEENY